MRRPFHPPDPTNDRGGDAPEAPLCHMLSFDVEEYFHCEVFRGAIDPSERSNWPSRIDLQLDALLELLETQQVRATFFVLGELAADRRDVVRRLAAAGHEIACHGQSHEMIARLGPAGFREDTRVGRDKLQQITGEPVLGYRAATFGLTRRTAWAIDILAELGFAYDSSVQPVAHDRYGVPDAPRQAHIAVGPGGGEILEIPPMTGRLVGRNIPLGGGGYFRLLPTVIFDAELTRWRHRRRPAMLYLHPWELDVGQPTPKISVINRFRHRVNLARTAAKLDILIKKHTFAPVREVLGSLEASASRRLFHYDAISA